MPAADVGMRRAKNKEPNSWAKNGSFFQLSRSGSHYVLRLSSL